MVRTGFLVAIIISIIPGLAWAGDFPAPGTVTGDKVRLRSGPSTNDPSLGHANRGDVLTVVGEQGDWLKVRCPGSAAVYISGKFVSPEGVVTGSGVRIRPTAGTKHAALGKVKKGDRLQVLGREGDWCKIRPPAATAVWISSRYVEIGGVKRAPRTENVGARRPVPKPRNRVLDLARDYMEVEREKWKTPESMDMDTPIRLLEELLRGNWPEPVKQEAQTLLEEAQDWKRIADAVREANRAINEPPPRPPYPKRRSESDSEADYLAVGWIEGRGKLFGRGATHKMIRGGQTTFLLRSQDFRLNDFVGKRVGILGVPVGYEGGRKIILVEDIRIFGR